MQCEGAQFTDFTSPLTVFVALDVILIPVPEHDSVKNDPHSKEEGFQDSQATKQEHPELPWWEWVGAQCLDLQTCLQICS